MKIVEILYTFSWDGFAVRYANGEQETLSPTQLMNAVGEDEYERLRKIAFRNGLTGHWHKVA